jgi:hypothetical protein
VYERLSSDVITLRLFIRRLARHLAIVSALVFVSLLIGIAGYRTFAAMSWVDAFLNACMLLGGMGPVGELPNDAAKIFAGCYALYAGLVFVASLGILLAPIVHRILHHFHAEDEGESN